MTEPKTTSLSAWKKAAVHQITLPSGASVEIKLPNLPALVKSGTLPNGLIEAAIRSQSLSLDTKITEDDIKQQADFYDYLVLQAVVEPKITEDALKEIPFEDIEMIVEIATRQRDVDAVGHHLGGLETSAEWRRFRGLSGGDEDLLDE